MQTHVEVDLSDVLESPPIHRGELPNASSTVQDAAHPHCSLTIDVNPLEQDHDHYGIPHIAMPTPTAALTGAQTDISCSIIDKRFKSYGLDVVSNVSGEQQNVALVPRAHVYRFPSIVSVPMTVTTAVSCPSSPSHQHERSITRAWIETNTEAAAHSPTSHPNQHMRTVTPTKLSNKRFTFTHTHTRLPSRGGLGNVASTMSPRPISSTISSTSPRAHLSIYLMQSRAVAPERGPSWTPPRCILEWLSCNRVSGSSIARFHSRMESYIGYITLMYFVSNLLCLLVLMGFLPRIMSIPLSILCCPHLLSRFLLFNVELCRELCRCFETWFLLSQIVLAMLALYIMMDWDIRCVCITTLGVCNILIIFYDAALMSPARKAAGLCGGIIFLMVWVITCAAGLWDIGTQQHDMTIYIGFAKMETTAESMFIQRELTLIVFCTKSWVQSIRHPNSFVILTSRLNWT